MPKLAIIRDIFLLPGRESDGVRWLSETEPMRRHAGQLAQFILHGQIDTREYRWVQLWQSYEAYDAWRRSPERQRLASERGRYMTHHPSRMFDVLD